MNHTSTEFEVGKPFRLLFIFRIWIIDINKSIFSS